MDNTIASDNNIGKFLYNDNELKTTSCNSSECNLINYDIEHKNKNEILKERIETLQNLIENLRVQLEDEKFMWRKEVEEVKKKPSPNCLHYCCDAESEIKYTDSATLNMSGYEKILLQYQEALQQARVDKKLSLQRQIAISNYKRRLLEVENMCNLELLRVKQNVQFLQPLKSMISEWNVTIDHEEKQDKIVNNLKDINVNQMPKEIDMPLELLGNQLQSNVTDDDNNDSSKPLLNSSMPQLTSSSTVWQTDDSYITHSQSTIWYSECQTKFNAY